MLIEFARKCILKRKREVKTEKKKKPFLKMGCITFLILLIFLIILGSLIFRNKPLYKELKDKAVFFIINNARKFTNKKIYIEGESELKYKALQTKKTEITLSKDKLGIENQKMESLEQRLSEKLDSLKLMRDEISDFVSQKEKVLAKILLTRSKQEEAKMKHELDYYKTLKFKDTMKIMNQMDDMDLLIYLLKNFDEADVTKFISSLEPYRAAEIIKALAASRAKDDVTNE